MSLLKQIGILLLALGIGVAFGRYTLPARVVEKNVEIVKEVTREVEVEKKDKKKNVQTKIVETWWPDGRHTKETYVLDTSTIVIDKRDETDTERESVKIVEKIIENAKPQWSASAGASFQQIYTFGIDRRVIGPVFAGLYGRTDKEFGVNVRLEF